MKRLLPSWLLFLLPVLLAHLLVLQALRSQEHAAPQTLPVLISLLPAVSPAKMSAQANHTPHTTIPNPGPKHAPQATAAQTAVPLQNIAPPQPNDVAPTNETAVATEPSPTAENAVEATPQQTVTAVVAEAPAVETPARFDAAYLENPSPVYPLASRRLGEQGTVILRVEVSAEGRPLQAEISRSSGYRRLDQAALDTVHQWRFVPARRGDTPINAWVKVPLRFALESTAEN